MSLVTGFTLITAMSDEDTVDGLNGLLVRCGKAKLEEVSDFASGSKHPQMLVWSGGYNYFESGPWPAGEEITIDGFVAAVLNAPWSQPRSVTLVVQHDGWDDLQTYRVGED